MLFVLIDSIIRRNIGDEFERTFMLFVLLDSKICRNKGDDLERLCYIYNK